MFWYIIILLFAGLLFWILLGPVILRIDSSLNNYKVILPGVVSIKVVPSEEELIYIRGWILFVPFRVKPLRQSKKKRSGKEKPETKKRKKMNFSGNARKFRKVLKAIHIRKLELDLDTDDFILNAWLVPVFSVMNGNENINMKVNFEGNLFLGLDIRTHIGEILWRFLTTK